MRVVMFYHSVVSDWNHGNAHFLRGAATELQRRGCEVSILEPAGGWSRENLIRDHGNGPIAEFQRAYPTLSSREYTLDNLDLDRELEHADVVLVHEWNDASLVQRVGRHRATRGGYQLLFHDTHHRAVTDPESMAGYDLSSYDGVLAFGNAIAAIYRERGWAERVCTWHEAADTEVFRPLTPPGCDGDLVWIGNWGDDERAEELNEFLIEPVRRLGLRARVYGVRYPESAIKRLQDGGIEYAGWLPNWRVPETFSRYRVTVHVPRRPYAAALPGIPTIRPFEAMACGIPLVSAPWRDTEELFRAGEDYLIAHDSREMIRHLSHILSDPEFAERMAGSGLRRIRERHTCSHRVDELLNICSRAQGEAAYSLTGNSK
jgi:spore maturation protein CgeB